ncbi:hypothetical protein SRHO_G00190790 [Serrasalmus rhombeus]
MKIPSIICFILWSIQSLSCQEIRMDQSPPQVKKPGESVKISSQGFGVKHSLKGSNHVPSTFDGFGNRKVC